MTKFLTAAALIIAVSTGSIAAMSTSAEAGPTSNFSINGQGKGNPFGAVNGN